MYGSDPLNRLDLNDYDALNDQVSAKPYLQGDSSVPERNRRLADYTQSTLLQLVRWDGLIHRFKQSETECGVYPKCCIDDLAGHGVGCHWSSTE